mmetsp:Transcript_17707/g.55291  ORF Transcript_17707/g.55291 Transcript_17707/m.55291 type:complete len:318 (-) Transcript_17707:784-1737(-)
METSRTRRRRRWRGRGHGRCCRGLGRFNGDGAHALLDAAAAAAREVGCDGPEQATAPRGRLRLGRGQRPRHRAAIGPRGLRGRRDVGARRGQVLSLSALLCRASGPVPGDQLLVRAGHAVEAVADGGGPATHGELGADVHCAAGRVREGHERVGQGERRQQATRVLLLLQVAGKGEATFAAERRFDASVAQARLALRLLVAAERHHALQHLQRTQAHARVPLGDERHDRLRHGLDGEHTARAFMCVQELLEGRERVEQHVPLERRLLGRRGGLSDHVHDGPGAVGGDEGLHVDLPPLQRGGEGLEVGRGGVEHEHVD